MDLHLSDDEKRIVASIDSVTTFDESMAVAKILYAHPDVQKEIEQYLKGKSQGNSDSAEGLDKIAKELGEGFGKKDGDTFVDNTVFLTGAKNYQDFIIPTSVMRLDITNSPNGQYTDPLPAYRQFVKESDAFVRQLASQFERRKIGRAHV